MTDAWRKQYQRPWDAGLKSLFPRSRLNPQSSTSDSTTTFFFFFKQTDKKRHYIREEQEFLYPMVWITEENGPEGFGVSRSEQAS